MKRSLLMMVIAVVMVVVSSCSASKENISSATATPNISVSPSPIASVASTAYGQNTQRDISSVEKSLLGHWLTESGSMHFFFADGKLTTLANDGSKMSSTYTVLESNDKERYLRIRILTNYGKGHDRNLVFSPDSTALVSTIKDFEETAYSVPQRWKYIDTKQAP